jgi:ERCC4-type nuclease
MRSHALQGLGLLSQYLSPHFCCVSMPSLVINMGRIVTVKLVAEPKPQQLVALVDTREQSPLDLSPLRVEVASLPTGDYSLRGLESVIAIERKSLPDLVGCVGGQRRRFDREVQRLLAYPVRLLVVEATWQQVEAGEWRGKIGPQTVISSLLGWMAAGLPVLLAGDHAQAGTCVARLLYLAARRRWREARGLVSAVLEPPLLAAASGVPGTHHHPTHPETLVPTQARADKL